MPEKEEWQNKGHGYPNNNEQRNRLLCQRQPDGKRYRNRRNQQLRHNKIDSDGSRPIALLSLILPPTHRAFIIHFKAPSEEFALPTIGTAQKNSSNKAGHNTWQDLSYLFLKTCKVTYAIVYHFRIRPCQTGPYPS